MKTSKRALFYVFIFCFFLNDLAAFQISKIPDQEKEKFQVLKEHRELFVESFANAYQNISLKQLRVNDLNVFLNKAFDAEEEEFLNPQENSVFFQAFSDDGQLLAYVAFDVLEKEQMAYVRQLAVKEGFKRQGIGKALIFAILDEYASLQKICTVTRRLNEQAKEFYQHIGFVQSQYGHEGLDPAIYVGYEWDLGSKVIDFPIQDAKVLEIPLEENFEPVVDLFQVQHPRIRHCSEFDSSLAISHQSVAKVRFSLYKALLKVLDYLPQDWGIAFYEGYRPLEIQKQYFSKTHALMQERYKDPIIALEECKKLVSDPEKCPVHSTAAAIDMTLFCPDKEGKLKLVDMGMFGAIFGINDQAATFAKAITKEQENNRRILLLAALKAGLVNYAHEWWHYSYGDRLWAMALNKEKAIYGPLAEELQELFIEQD